MEVLARQICPQHLPELHHVGKDELALEQDKYPAKAKVHVRRVVLLQIERELGVDKLDQILQVAHLQLDVELIHEKIRFLCVFGRQKYEKNMFSYFVRAYVNMRTRKHTILSM